MSKITFYCDSGANIHSRNEEVFDGDDIWGMSREDWESLTESQKYKVVEEWAWNVGLEIGWNHD